MTILTERIPKPTTVRRRIDELRKALADLEYLLPVAERVHGTAKQETITRLIAQANGVLKRGDDPLLAQEAVLRQQKKGGRRP